MRSAAAERQARYRQNKRNGHNVTRDASPKKGPLNVSFEMLARSRGKPAKGPGVNSFAPAKPPPGVVPAGQGMAMDDALCGGGDWASNEWANSSFAAEYVERFLGYPALSFLAQRPEYRRISEQIAMHMTRKWIKLQASGDEDKTDEIKELGDELDRLKARDAFRKIAEQDGFFGRGHLYLDLGTTDDPAELKTPIGAGGDKISEAKIAKGSLKALRAIEAVWTYPVNYNSSNPLRSDWFKPEQWWVNGTQVHSSRLLTFVGREVPDMLKPAYSFGGLSMSQMAKPYVDNWLKVQSGVSDIITAFSVFVLSTNLFTSVQADGDQVFKRAELFNNLRDNRGLMMLDKDGETFSNVAAPLGTLDALQAQAQEHMAAVSGIPLVFLLGISPHGLNASSEGEIRAFYDWIHAYQEMLFTDKLKRVIDFAQLSLWGKIDPAISFIFEPLWSLDEKAQAEVRKLEAETDDILINGCNAISPEESRIRVAGDPDTPFAGLDPDDVPEPPVDPSAINLKGTAPIEGKGGALAAASEKAKNAPGDKQREAA